MSYIYWNEWWWFLLGTWYKSRKIFKFKWLSGENLDKSEHQSETDTKHRSKVKIWNCPSIIGNDGMVWTINIKNHVFENPGLQAFSPAASLEKQLLFGLSPFLMCLQHWVRGFRKLLKSETVKGSSTALQNSNSSLAGPSLRGPCSLFLFSWFCPAKASERSNHLRTVIHSPESVWT